jgi:hypothetical protein
VVNGGHATRGCHGFFFAPALRQSQWKLLPQRSPLCPQGMLMSLPRQRGPLGPLRQMVWLAMQPPEPGLCGVNSALQLLAAAVAALAVALLLCVPLERESQPEAQPSMLGMTSMQPSTSSERGPNIVGPA